MTIGENIKKFRKERKLTQEQLGNILGVKKAAIQKYENGTVKNLKQETIKKLSEYFGVDPINFIEAPPSKNEYIFTKLLRCSECNYTLNATFKNRPNKKYIYYRCRKHYDLHQCSAKSLLNEKIVEKHLLENLNTEIEKYIYSFSVEQTKKKPKPKISISEINEEIERLNYSYQKKTYYLRKVRC